MAALDFPSSPTVGQQYAAPNGVTYQWDGAAWVVTGGPPGQLWTGAGSNLTPTDATKTIAAGTSTTNGIGFVMGATTVKARLRDVGAAGMQLESNTTGTAVDDATKASWFLQLNPSNDVCDIYRAPAGSTTFTNIARFDAGGSFTISGAFGVKSTGTTWANPSDSRIKKNIAPYAQGLAAIVALEPKTFEFNGLAGSQDGLPAIGLIADDVQPIMPEMISVQPTKLHADDPAPVDLLMLDTTALAMALINAVKEIAARVAALEAHA